MVFRRSAARNRTRRGAAKTRRHAAERRTREGRVGRGKGARRTTTEGGERARGVVAATRPGGYLHLSPRPSRVAAMNLSRRSAAVGALLLAVLTTPAADAPTTPLRQAHAHNDYEHPRPLFDALDQGFCSVEADIYLVDG